MKTVRDVFYGRELYSASLFDWERVAQEYIPHFMWYRDVIKEDGSKVRAAWCSYCSCFNEFDKKEDYDIYTGYHDLATCKHKSLNYCPCCERYVTFINENLMTSYNSLQEVKRLIFSDFIDKDHVNFYAVRVRNYPDSEFEQQVIDFEPCTCYELSPGSVKMFRFNGEDWIERKNFGEPFNTYFGHGGDYEFVLLGNECDFDGTFLQYAQFHDFENVGMSRQSVYGDRYYYYMTYLCQYSLHPQLEYLMKVGSYKWVYDLVYDRNLNKRFIDWSAKNFADLFRMNKKEAKEFMLCNLSPTLLKIYYDNDKKVSVEDLCSMFKDFSSEFYQDIVDMCVEYHITVDKLKKYFSTHYIQRDRFNSRLYDSTFQFWRDYVNACETLSIDLLECDMLFPKDLVKAHDERVAQVEVIENKRLVERAQRSFERRDKQYCFEDDQFIIYLPHTFHELIEESNMQDNCVAKNYTEKHFKDETTILFLREKSCIDQSFYTIEIQGRTVRQKHGYLNDQMYSTLNSSRRQELWAKYMSRPRDKADAFYKRWLAWVKAGSPRDINGVPITIIEKERKKA